MKILASLVCAFGLSLTNPVVAQPDISGTITDWLGGEEVNSLTAFSVAASNGNTDAQLLLGQIDRDMVPGGFSDYLYDLSSTERAALLRATKDGNDINWLIALSDPARADLGQALFGYRIGLDPIGDALALQRNGEPVASSYVVWNTMNNGRFDLVNSIPDESYGLSDAGFLTWVGEYVADPNKGLTMSRIANDPSPVKVEGLLAVKRLARVLNLNQYFSTEVDQFITIVIGRGSELPDDANLVLLNQNLSTVAEIDGPLSIVQRFCSKCTAGTVDYDCMIQALEIVNGYRTLMSVRTPVENVISAEVFLQSERPAVVFEQLLKTRAKYYARPIRSQCIADHLAQ